jgi:predicted dithiol-disulfide oxidoreductase (DUF899 family)
VTLPDVVDRQAWTRARRELLAAEKDLTRHRDRVNTARRELPMVRVEEDYRFTGPDGALGLLDLFDGRRQLVVHHFMWTYDVDADGNRTPLDTACPSCSSAADGIGTLRQLHRRNTTLVAVSNVPFGLVEAFRRRGGWTFPWFSSFGSSFNVDFHATVDERLAPVQVHHRDAAELVGTPFEWRPELRGDWPGISVFLAVDGEVFHTYSTYGRGLEEFHNDDPYLDLTPLGRQEPWERPAGRAVPLGLHVGGPNTALTFPT